jgi:hypothetical protein
MPWLPGVSGPSSSPPTMKVRTHSGWDSQPGGIGDARQGGDHPMPADPSAATQGPRPDGRPWKGPGGLLAAWEREGAGPNNVQRIGEAAARLGGRQRSKASTSVWTAAPRWVHPWLHGPTGPRGPSDLEEEEDMLMRFDPFRELDRLTQQAWGPGQLHSSLARASTRSTSRPTTSTAC